MSDPSFACQRYGGFASGARGVPTVNGAAAFVETMTIAEARALWVELNKMFGAKQ